jgi:predicted O-methyltransferase YrrM
MRWPSNERYYLVDVWAPLLNYKDDANIDIAEQEEILTSAKARLQPYANQTVFLRNLTSEAANIIPDNSLDFIYVDARHDYCGCMLDLQMYWPKLRHGGLMAGHDFLTAAQHAAAMPGDDWSLCEDGSVHEGAVKAAVTEFAAEHGLFLYVTQEGPWISWMFSLKI